MITHFLMAFGQDAADAIAQIPPVKETLSFSLIEMAFKGGWIMIPLLLLSILTLYIFGERWWAIRNASKTDENFMRNIHDYIHEGKIKAAISLCQSQETPIARLIEKGVERIGRPLNDIQTAVENMGNVEVSRLEKGLPMLATIAGGAPMLGFLGTVIGMIQAFYNMSQAGSNVDITLLSGGIYTAMVTTVAGLTVGILAYFGYNYLTARIDDIVYKMESNTIEFMDLLHEPASK
ncbi:MAG: biopolymer transporter ExbB [Bacteroidetes bacterium GWE2_39_28]|nr:MAG: biopolymer transporter ExbB [Bacteroidetes bacterium GWE2_39_28]OFY13257.1 MAG: biopolymer transporter ExbB [Bacteroidetes bacterium GWF2_39_10]OFZ11456.1 MAG: biopolymer transporter ExbB [Bacteroidetes bacterium RIFOXYC2_FULL_39_11]HCT94292.1 biopolymer transporter ExbB [Rikenellaceae bacterium]